YHGAFGRALRETRGLAGLGGLPGGDTGAVDPAHLARADAYRGASLGVDDRIRLHVLGDAEGEQQVVELRGRGGALGDGLELLRADAAVVARLQEITARERAERDARRRGIRQLAGLQDAQLGLLLERLARVRTDLRRDYHLREKLPHQLGGRDVERA